MKKAREFFDQLQTNSLIKYFSKNYYRSLITIPNVELYRGKQNTLMAEVWIAEECTEQEVKDYVQDTLQEIQPYL